MSQSEFEENVRKMRSIRFEGDKEEVIERLKDVPGWTFEPNGTPGNQRPALTNDDGLLISLSTEGNHVTTVNVLPHDYDQNPDAANDALMALSEALEKVQIGHEFRASDHDLGRSPG